MRVATALLLAAALVGCSDRRSPPAAGYAHFKDRLLAASGLAGLLSYPCTYKVAERGSQTIERLEDQDCYRFKPPTRMKGIWIDEFEGSQFIRDAAKRPNHLGDGQTWLNLDEKTLAARHASTRALSGQRFVVDFVGREVLFPGQGYGHMGGSSNLVVVDRMISMREICDRCAPSAY